MPTVKNSRRRGGLWAEGQRDQLYPPVTIKVLPSTVLLEIFSFYVDRPGADEDVWHTLVHVCRQWRFVVFDSPRRLNLRLLCTQNRPMTFLDIWPALPIVINSWPTWTLLWGSANIVAALKQHYRVRKINIRGIPNPLMHLMDEFAAMKKPFPELTYLGLELDDRNVPMLPDSFLGGSAPRLRTLDLYGIPFPAVGKLLLSTRYLNALHLRSIPHSGYISPEEMVTCLSTLTGLRVFSLGFRSPKSQVDRGTRRVPPLTRIVLPALTKFAFKGNSEYLEDIISLIDTPLLDYFEVTFFNQLIFDTPRLHDFISRTEKIKAHYRANVRFNPGHVVVHFPPQDRTADHEGLFLAILCTALDWQLSSLAQVCGSSLPALYTLEYLEIISQSLYFQWQDAIGSTEWLELLYPFTSVKNLVLSWGLVPPVTPALQELAVGRVTEVLPMLENLHLEGPQQENPIEEAIRLFTAARQLSGHPVAVNRLGWLMLPVRTWAGN